MYSNHLSIQVSPDTTPDIGSWETCAFSERPFIEFGNTWVCLWPIFKNVHNRFSKRNVA